MGHVVLLLGCAVAIYLACEWFVNAVEWLGVQLRVGPLAVGTVLAAVGTALPESVVTLVAVTLGGSAHGSPHGADIGVGAALGGPLVVGTIAYAVVGATLLLRGRRRAFSLAGAPRSVGAARAPELVAPHRAAGQVDAELAGVDIARLSRDQLWFLAIFVVKVALGLVAFGGKSWLGLAFFAGYGLYFWREMRGGRPGDPESGAAPAPLKLRPRQATPSRTAVAAQTVVTLALIFAASQLFVHQLEWAGRALGLTPVVVALLLSPIATELPETMNALIWVRQGKTELALANISGAMMIQATIPSGLGLLFTPWRFGPPLLLAGLATMLAVGYLLVLSRLGRLTPARLAAAALAYSAFALALSLTH